MISETIEDGVRAQLIDDQSECAGRTYDPEVVYSPFGALLSLHASLDHIERAGDDARDKPRACTSEC